MHRVRAAVGSSVGGLPTAFWWIWVATLVSSLGGFVVPFLALWLTTERGFSVTVAGVVGTLFGLGSVVGAVLGGVSADRIGRKPTLLAAQLVAAGAVLALGFTSHLVAIIALAFLVGLGTNATRPARTAVLADVVAAADRVRAFSLNFWAINLGFAIAPVMAGLMAGRNYVVLFVGNAIALLLCALVVQLRVPETRPPGAVAAKQQEGEGGLAEVLRDRVFMAFVTLTALLAMIYMQHGVTLPLAIHDSGLSAAQYGVVIALNGMLIVVLQMPLTRLVERRRRSRVLALAALLSGVGFGLTGVADVMWAYALTVVVWTLGEILNAPTSMAVVADLSPAHLRGRYQGVYTLSWSLASLAAPLGGAWVYERLGSAVLWGGCAVLGGIVAVGHLAIARARGVRLREIAAAGAGGADSDAEVVRHDDAAAAAAANSA